MNNRRWIVTVSLLLVSPAAWPIDNDVCLGCHQDAATRNPESPHLRSPVRCESCHGDGSRHVKEGDPKLIRSFKGKPAAEVCTTCHKGQHVVEWKASRHHEVGVDCADCHAVHLVKDPKGSCKSCH